MRQIRICAQLWMTALAVLACSGGEFASNDEFSSAGAEAGADAGPTSEVPQPSDDKGSQGGSRGLSIGGGSLAGAANTGGAASTGGGASSAGTTSVPPTAGGAKAEECATGSVTIRMLPSPKLPKDYLCDASCGTGWLTITDAEGATAFSISAACGTASCDTCEVQTCGAAPCLPTALTGAGSEVVWNGQYLAKDTCGDHMACQRQACVKPGKYKARACAALNQGESSYGCTPQEAQLCAETEFEFPSEQQVVLLLEN
ncbi:MAG: hypothetical protein EOO73_32445 [Myxococcales bacterium]|nr:MAG: hypothetical protein EOO73_32445 [Myxococcales bacterium]